MTNYTQTEAAKEIKETARKNGLTFKKMNTTFNGAYLWMFTDRKTGIRVLEKCQFWASYENCINGYIDTLKR